MDPKFGIFIAITSILTMAVYSSSTNFVSAASECFGEGSGLDHLFCIGTKTQSNGEVHTWVYECVRDKDGHWDCHSITKKATPPGVDQIIQNTIQEVGPSNPNDSKDLGGMQTDKGITKSPIE